MAHVEIGEKTNEIPAAQKLPEELDVAGNNVTLDAMRYQRTFEVAAAARAHLVAQLKDNRLALCRRAEAVYAKAPHQGRRRRPRRPRLHYVRGVTWSGFRSDRIQCPVSNDKCSKNPTPNSSLPRDMMQPDRNPLWHEDASRIRKNPTVFTTIRSFAYNILRFNLAGSFVQTRFTAALGGFKSLASLPLCQEN